MKGRLKGNKIIERMSLPRLKENFQPGNLVLYFIMWQYRGDLRYAIGEKMEFIEKYTDGSDTDFAKLSEEVEKEFYEMYGEAQSKYTAYNGLLHIRDVLLMYDGRIPFACGGFKEYSHRVVELKRVYVNKAYRGNGYSTYIVRKLIDRAKDKGYETMILETGQKQIEAISLYKKLEFQIIENYGQYKGDSNSICMSIRL
jgi:GNAT superfamily N-acetyltransferase